MHLQKYQHLLRVIVDADPEYPPSINRLVGTINECIDGDGLLTETLNKAIGDNDPQHVSTLLSTGIKEAVAGLIDEIVSRKHNFIDMSARECIKGWILSVEMPDKPVEKMIERELLTISLSEALNDKAKLGDTMALAFIGSTVVANLLDMNDIDFVKFLEANVLQVPLVKNPIQKIPTVNLGGKKCPDQERKVLSVATLARKAKRKTKE